MFYYTKIITTFAPQKLTDNTHNQKQSFLIKNMPSIKNFDELTAHLASKGTKSRVAVVWAEDDVTRSAVLKALEAGIITVTFVGCRQEKQIGFSFYIRVEDTDQSDLLLKVRRSGNRFIQFLCELLLAGIQFFGDFMIDPVTGLQISVLLFLLCLSTDQVVFLLDHFVGFHETFLCPMYGAFILYPKSIPGPDHFPV